ncbi:MAG TPA: bifunctional riboflavin kinase/FAD synthetase [Gemmataceae bacterium]|nr:bifunctional riboflavin kinase/FAD synthetase [Gemmataceae bacterium]
MPTLPHSWLPSLPPSVRHGALTIGNFDGVHRGHAAILAELKASAKNVGGPAVVMTFDPHPLQILQPDKFLPVLTTTPDRVELLKAAGADHVVVLPVTRELLQLTARSFFDDIIRGQFQPRSLIEGPDFAFGYRREGNVGLLWKWCGEADIRFAVVETFQLDGQPVSSSRVRDALLKGDVKRATRLLGREYRLQGVVSAGQRRGNQLGFPTANLEQIATVVPGDGVYAVRVKSAGTIWPGAANIGPNPTFGENARKVEVHLIGFHGTLYGESLKVDFVERLRDTRPFNGVTELIDQLHKDVAAAQTILNLHS